jgi:hypothetical protein
MSLATIRKKKKYTHKNTIFLGLIKKYRVYDFGVRPVTHKRFKSSVTYIFFKNYHPLLMNIFYVFDLVKAWVYLNPTLYKKTFTLVRYYALNADRNYNLESKAYKNSGIIKRNNLIIFSRPSKQLFFTIFKSKPIFIFTGGLMRIVMREKRKSSKKLYKVATSLIKLFSILLVKKHFFQQGYIKLVNVGRLKAKILKALIKTKMSKKITYILINFRIDFTSQKLETRRAIKKYVKKRFRIR